MKLTAFTPKLTLAAAALSALQSFSPLFGRAAASPHASPHPRANILPAPQQPT